MINYLDFSNINIHEYFCTLNIIGFSWTQVKNMKINKHTIMAILISCCPNCQRKKKAKNETPICLTYSCPWLIKK